MLIRHHLAMGGAMTLRAKIICLVAALQIALMVTMGVLLLKEHQANDVETFRHVGTSLKNALLRVNEETQKRYTQRVAGFANSSPEITQAFIHRDLNLLKKAIQPKIETLQNEDSFFAFIAFIEQDGRVFYHSADHERVGKNVRHVPFAHDSLVGKEPLGGLALARNGIAYRFSYPIFSRQDYVGMVVFVVKPTKALELLKQDFGAECGVFAYTDATENINQESPYAQSNRMLVDFSGSLFGDNDFLLNFPFDNSGVNFAVDDQQSLLQNYIRFFEYSA